MSSQLAGHRCRGHPIRTRSPKGAHGRRLLLSHGHSPPLATSRLVRCPIVSGGSSIAASEAARLVAAEKDAAGATATWIEARLASGLLVRKVLAPFALNVNPPPATGQILVCGDWRRADLIQIRMVLTREKSEINLERLCLDPAHMGELHWHHLEQVSGGGGPPMPVKDRPGVLDEEWMLHEEFVPKMKITNLARTFKL